MSERLETHALLLRAASFAAEKHAHQRREGSETPYINHPLELACLLSEEGGINDVQTLCAAILHDTLEYTETSVLELKQGFGEEITALVLEVTDDQSLSPLRRREMQCDRAPTLSPAAKCIKLADKISNLQAMLKDPISPHALPEIRAYFDFAMAVVSALGAVNPPLEAMFHGIYQKRP